MKTGENCPCSPSLSLSPRALISRFTINFALVFLLDPLLFVLSSSCRRTTFGRDARGGRSCGCTWTETEQRARGPRTRMPGAPSRDCALRPFTNHGARTPLPPLHPHRTLATFLPFPSLEGMDGPPPCRLLDNFTFSRRERRRSKREKGRGEELHLVESILRGRRRGGGAIAKEDKRISTGYSLPFIILLKLLETPLRFVIVDGHFAGLMTRRRGR